MFYHQALPDTLPELGDFVGCPAYAVYDSGCEAISVGPQSRKQAADIHPGTNIEVRMAHFPEKLEMFAAVLVGKGDHFHVGGIIFPRGQAGLSEDNKYIFIN